MSNYFIRNMETGKIELHFEKNDYLALSNEEKQKIKSNFLFSRNANVWVSRCKFPNWNRAETIAKELKLDDAGCNGERVSFGNQMENKMGKAMHRAEKMEYKAGKAMENGIALQKPINDMHDDIAFFTQPNINSSSGKAFTNRRNRMFEMWEKGFEEFKRSEYYSECAEKARRTANGENLKDKAFCQRRIEEAETNIRSLKRRIEEYESYRSDIEGGKIPKDKFGWSLKNLTIDIINRNVERWNEVMEYEIEKSVFYHECIEAMGGIFFNKENLHKGDLIQISKYHNCVVKIVRFGAKNVTFEFTEKHMTYADGKPMLGKCSYAEIERIMKAC